MCVQNNCVLRTPQFKCCNQFVAYVGLKSPEMTLFGWFWWCLRPKMIYKMSQEFPAASLDITKNTQPLFRHTATKALCDQCYSMHLWCWTPANNIKNLHYTGACAEMINLQYIYKFHFSPTSSTYPLMAQLQLKTLQSSLWKTDGLRDVQNHDEQSW